MVAQAQTFFRKHDACAGTHVASAAASASSVASASAVQVSDVGEAMSLGLKAATLISEKFPPPVKLEFEKV